MTSIFHRLSVPTCFHFPSQNPPKLLPASILEGFKILIQTGIDFLIVQNRFWKAKGPKTAPRGRHDTWPAIPSKQWFSKTKNTPKGGHFNAGPTLIRRGNPSPPLSPAHPRVPNAPDRAWNDVSDLTRSGLQDLTWPDLIRPHLARFSVPTWFPISIKIDEKSMPRWRLFSTSF